MKIDESMQKNRFYKHRKEIKRLMDHFTFGAKDLAEIYALALGWKDYGKELADFEALLIRAQQAKGYTMGDLFK